tara:strand:+ start:786 stop:1091 length:306 start_codon:yes stop_codon:yes gene_type:complete
MSLPPRQALDEYARLTQGCEQSLLALRNLERLQILNSLASSSLSSVGIVYNQQNNLTYQQWKKQWGVTNEWFGCHYTGKNQREGLISFLSRCKNQINSDAQ